MRTIIAGSRTVTDYGLIADAVQESGFDVSVVLCGCANGVDMLGKQWASNHRRSVCEFPADWYHLGKKAGILRNIEMAKNADALIAVWDGKSRGTRLRGLMVYVKRISIANLSPKSAHES